MASCTMPLPRWIGPGHQYAAANATPPSGVLPYWPSRIRAATRASHRPVVGSALNWQGQPHAQLHVATSSATIRHEVFVAVAVITPPPVCLKRIVRPKGGQYEQTLRLSIGRTKHHQRAADERGD